MASISSGTPRTSWLETLNDDLLKLRSTSKAEPKISHGGIDASLELRRDLKPIEPIVTAFFAAKSVVEASNGVASPEGHIAASAETLMKVVASFEEAQIDRQSAALESNTRKAQTSAESSLVVDAHRRGLRFMLEHSHEELSIDLLCSLHSKYYNFLQSFLVSSFLFRSPPFQNDGHPPTHPTITLLTLPRIQTKPRIGMWRLG